MDQIAEPQALDAPAAGSFDIDEKIFAMIRGRRVAVPPYPAVALRLQEVTSRPRFAIGDVVDVASADQALTATVLRSANSSMFSGMGSATTLQQAVARLGASEVARLALTAGLAESMKMPGALQGMRRQAWAEGVASAAVSHALAAQRGLSQRDAFTCGLLHDFGRIVGIACIELVLAANPEIAGRSEEVWRASLDRVVPELGALVASAWNLPPLLQQAMTLRTPQAWAKSVYAPLLEVVGLSESVVAMMMRDSHVSAAELAQLEGLHAAEREPLADMLPSVPATIASFESEQPRKAAPTKLVAPATTLGTEPLRALSLPIEQLQPMKRGPFRMLAINNAGWSMVGEQSLPERQMFEASIAPIGGAPTNAPLKLWASTTLCAPEAGCFRLECKPFALDREGKRRWLELVQWAKAHSA